jgi:hypothetical protein
LPKEQDLACIGYPTVQKEITKRFPDLENESENFVETFPALQVEVDAEEEEVYEYCTSRDLLPEPGLCTYQEPEVVDEARIEAKCGALSYYYDFPDNGDSLFFEAGTD